ncbi:MAG TPA: serine/threonine-protein kinase, partial [Vicinamibacteria bacterium]
MELRQFGRYRIVEKLGQGAMGEVFRAVDPVLERSVAIKIITAKLSGDEKARDRFLREAKAAARLNHPNIITVHEFSEEKGVAYMAMELLEGRDLRQILERGEIPSLEDRLAVMEQVLDGLAYAHANGVVHRDLKPGNVHVQPSGRVKIVDFGLAQRVEDVAASGPIMGTPYYMAPEQAQGEKTTSRSDVFSAGAMFYELLGQKRPFAGATIPAVLFAVVHRDPPPLADLVPDLPEGVAGVVMRALQKSPDARWADGTEMREALREAWSMPEGWMEDPGPVYVAEEAARQLGPPLSAREDTPAEVRAAIEEINQYLDDRVPPLMVADSVATFSQATPEGGASEVLGWAARQQQMQPDLPSVELLFHALHKLSVVGIFQLVNREKLLAYLRQVGQVLASACPPGPERERFQKALLHLGEWETVHGGPLEMKGLRSQGDDLPPLTGSPGLRRLSFLEQRIRREKSAKGEAAARARRRVVSQAIAAAATEAKSEKELESFLHRLRKIGVTAGPEQAFRNLGQELANWVLPKQVSDTADLGPSSEVQAMKKIVALAEDPVEVARRYRFLVTAAIEQFNEGNLGRAMQMFELASKLAVEKKIESGFIEPVVKKGYEALDPARLRQYMDTPDRHPQLQAVMAFFEVGLGAKTLLDQLETESRRDRRRLLLDLLVVHGETGRGLARARLLGSLGTTAPDFARRNWIYLLRLVPRPASDPAEPEIAAVARFASPGSPNFLMKEALTYLSQTRHPRVADALVALLGTWERELEGEEIDATEEEEAFSILDRVAAALARQGGPKGWRALVSHALSRRPEFGSTVARLSELGTQDLSPGPDVVATL